MAPGDLILVVLLPDLWLPAAFQRLMAIGEPTPGPLFSMVWVVLPQWHLGKTQTLSFIIDYRRDRFYSPLFLAP